MLVSLAACIPWWNEPCCLKLIHTTQLSKWSLTLMPLILYEGYTSQPYFCISLQCWRTVKNIPVDYMKLYDTNQSASVGHFGMPTYNEVPYLFEGSKITIMTVSKAWISNFDILDKRSRFISGQGQMHCVMMYNMEVTIALHTSWIAYFWQPAEEKQLHWRRQLVAQYHQLKVKVVTNTLLQCRLWYTARWNDLNNSDFL